MRSSVVLAVLSTACGAEHVTSDAGPDAAVEAASDAAVDAAEAGCFGCPQPPPGSYCALAGSRVSTSGGVLVIGAPQNVMEPDLSFINLPVGFCAHYFATVSKSRAIRFAPNGELFVASPSNYVAGGAVGGLGAIVDIPDDDHDGYGDSVITFQNNLTSTQGILFANSAFYFQDQTRIMSVPYTSGERVNSAVPTQVVDINVYTSLVHWPKTLDVADDGTIYVSNGGDDGAPCLGMPHTFEGGIVAIDGSANGKQIASGFRNPMYLRCQRGHNGCFADELTADGSGGAGGREKMVLVAAGDWGFPCCATHNLPYAFLSDASSLDCSGVQAETVMFKVGETPFGLDFETGVWPAPYTRSAFIALHGSFSSWVGERIVAIQTDPATGRPVPSTDLGGKEVGGMSDFITGFDDGTRSHGRPADITFAADGRMYVANDANGVIFWVAPITLMR
jgi:glucose/arabinose dehydrogenase